ALHQARPARALSQRGCRRVLAGADAGEGRVTTTNITYDRSVSAKTLDPIEPNARCPRRRRRKLGDVRGVGEEVVCGRHGTRAMTFACRHVAGGVACGFWIAPPDPEYGRPDATCDLCDERMQAGIEIDSKDLVILCTHCWDEARARNETV